VSSPDLAHSRRAGFTLIELLVVIAIIATLATVVAPDLIRHVSTAKSQAARSQIDALSLALEAYRMDNDRYPTTAEGLTALRVPPGSKISQLKWNGPYLRRDVPADPWGRAFVYLAPGAANPQSFDLFTLGRDGIAGGQKEDGDVTSWGGAVSSTSQEKR
jgi:general secretion pathway protein G